MTNLVLLALTLALFQIWLIPMFLNLKNMNYLLSNRDEPLETSITVQRVLRASANLQESLLPFLALVLVGIILEENLITLGYAWLALRVAYLLCYSYGIEKIRSVVWIASVVVLVLMALRLMYVFK